MKIIIPSFIEYNACQLTEKDLDKFKKFISGYACDIKITYKEVNNKQVLLKINFR